MLSAQDIRFSYGDKEILQGLRLSLLKGDRVALVGSNGSGKSTLLNILAGELDYSGTVSLSPKARIGYLRQEPHLDKNLTVIETMKNAIKEHADAISMHQNLCAKLGNTTDPGQQKQLVNQIDRLMKRIEIGGGFDIDFRISWMLNQLGIKTRDQKIGSLSGGERRRVSLAYILLQGPEIYLLDEPTNHLDIEAIRFLEDFLKSHNGASLFISHDRAFIDAVATKIIELDKGKLYTHEPPFANYLDKKLVRELIDKRTLHRKERLLVSELAWLRAGTPARTTKQNARIDRAHELMNSVAKEMDKQRKEKLAIKLAAEKRLGKTIIEFKDVSASYGEKILFNDFNLKACAQQKYGIIGPNGSGKSTLLSFIKGDKVPQSGLIKFGKNTQVLSFEQHRDLLAPHKSLKENLCDQGDYVFIDDKKIHVATYLESYLFDPKDANRKVCTLSGGEQNRLLMAKLFKKTANCLLMDEPTNDLDTESLSVLEEILLAFTGVVFCVSHDRGFLNRIATSMIVFEPSEIQSSAQSHIVVYPGNFDDYLRLKPKQDKQSTPRPELKTVKNEKRARKKTRRSYKEEREFNHIEEIILRLESERDEINNTLSDPQFFKASPNLVQEKIKRAKELEKEIESLYERWQELLDMEPN